MVARYVLLDRDGTIIKEQDYLRDPAGVELLPGAASGMRRILDAGWRIVIVTNQSGIGRGYYTESDYAAVNARLLELLSAEEVQVDGVYHCPHAPGMACDCRKPLTGMAEAAAHEHGFALDTCVVAGDKPADVELGRAIGAKSILVRTGYGRQHETECNPDYIADDLDGVADYVWAL